MLSKSSVKNACITVLPKQRDGGVEVFRCLMMFLVVLCHTIGGALEHNKLPLIAITLLGVPGFLAISGWYGIRFTWKKWFSIVALTAYYSVFVYLMTRVGSHYGYCKGPNALRLAGGWFMGPYLALMLLAPILNAGLEALLAKGRQTLLLVGGGGVIFLAFFNWISYIPDVDRLVMRVAGMERKTVMALIVIYIVLRCARLLEMDKIISTKLLMLCLGLSAMFFIMSVYIAADITWDIRSTASCWSVVPRIGYNAPPTFILAGVLFLLFQRWHPPTIVTRIALFLGPSLLAVYLIHICSSAGQDLMVNRPFQWGVDNFPHLPHQVISIGTAGYCFIVCIAIDLIRRFALTFFRHCLHRIAIIRSRTSLP